MITYEVVARYVFNAPTIWAEEMSRFFQVWAVYLGAAYVLRYRYLIRITLLTDHIGPLGRRIAEGFSLFVIAAVCDEEDASIGTKALLAGCAADASIVLRAMATLSLIGLPACMPANISLNVLIFRRAGV